MMLLDALFKKTLSLDALYGVYLAQSFFVKVVCEVLFLNVLLFVISLLAITLGYWIERLLGGTPGSWYAHCKKKLPGQFVLSLVVYAVAVYFQ